MYDAITWIFAIGVILALLVAYGLGANDVANMFGPSVGARALSMRQALLVAAVFEFLGAVLMGSGVADTIRSGITNIDYFTDRPDILAYGMMCALAGTGVWMMIATYIELPVSSTQAIVASVGGMAIVAEGWNAVVWTGTTAAFPHVKGMATIFLSWVFAPLLAALASFLLFGLIRTFILRHDNAHQRSMWLLPMFVFITFFVVTWFTIVKGAPQYNWSKMSEGKKAWISVVVAAGCCLISILVGIPLLKRKVQRDLDAQEERTRAAEKGPIDLKCVDELPTNKDTAITIADTTADISSEGSGSATPPSSVAVEGAKPPGVFRGMFKSLQKSAIWRTLNYSMDYDIHKVVESDSRVGEIHANSENFDTKAEASFKYLQVCTACANAFAHGSNEVANAVGPLAAIYQVWQYGQAKAKNPVPTWLLAYGGIGICLGLATYGYKMMRAMGVKMTRLTNSRGFCVEVCVAAVVIIASRFNIPMSSTPATVGAIAGVGLWEGRRGLNGMLLVKMVAGWVVTIIAAVFLTCVFMLQGLYAPSKNGTPL